MPRSDVAPRVASFREMTKSRTPQDQILIVIIKTLIVVLTKESVLLASLLPEGKF